MNEASPVGVCVDHDPIQVGHVDVYVDPISEISAARSITLPGGVRLTAQEIEFRSEPRILPLREELPIARRILAKVRRACGVGE